VSQHHDPVHPEPPHLDAEVIADLQLGLLDGDSAAHAQAHLDECATCRGVGEALTQVSRTLADLPPVTVPDAVAARWAAALAAEPVLAPAGGGATVVPMSPREPTGSGKWGGRGLAVAATGAGILLVAALAYPMLTGGSDNTPPAASGATSTERATIDQAAIPAATTSGTQYRTAALETQVATELSTYQTPAVTASDTAISPDVSPTVTVSSVGTPGTMSASGGTSAPSGPLLVVDRAAELACLSSVLLPGTVPLLVDVATYEGKPAVVIVVPADNDPSRMDIWVMARHCTASQSHLLYWTRTDRP
jgi:hypothetical protein